MKARFPFRIRAGLLVRVLCLALLVAQIGAQAHAYSHLAPDQLGVPSALQSCGQCLSFAPLHTIMGGSSTVWIQPLADIAQCLPTIELPVPYRRACPAFRSRAPPHFL
jgi:hypothetical protein